RPNIRKPVLGSTSVGLVTWVLDDKKLRIPTKPRLPASQQSVIWDARQKPGKQDSDIPMYTTPSIRRPLWSPRPQGSEEKVIYQPPAPENQGSTPFWNPRSDGYDEPIRRPSVRKITPGDRKERNKKSDEK
ncbi:MAG TPA: hypothetical protein VIH61_08545, partial [Waddliaceae bacterium]